MFNSSAALPVNARDDKGSVLKAWSKVVEPISDPLIAEATTLFWVFTIS
jgi:hypothetical protein